MRAAGASVLVAAFALLLAVAPASALSGVAATSSGDPFGATYAASKAVDGDIATGWATTGSSASGTWLQVTFTAACTTGVTWRTRQSGAGDDNPTATLTTSDGQSVALASRASSTAAVTTSLSGATLTWVRLTFTANVGVGNPGYAEVLPVDTACPTPAPLTCTPSCAVSLVTVDRDRLDYIGGALTLGLFVLVTITTGVLVTTGLRR